MATDQEEVLSETILFEKENISEVAHHSSDRYTVLLVEDNPDVVTYLSSVLLLHFRIVTAANGQQGIDQLPQGHPGWGQDIKDSPFSVNISGPSAGNSRSER